MAKVAFSKLSLKKNEEVKTITFNDITIEVKQYLPASDKLELLSKIINRSMVDESRYFNELKIEVFLGLEFLFYYTNISFTAKQLEDEVKLFDLVKGNGLLDAVIHASEEEYINLKYYVYSIAGAIYKYQNSAVGVLNTISQDYSNLNFDLEKLQSQISDPDSLKLLKEIGPMIGLS